MPLLGFIDQESRRRRIKLESAKAVAALGLLVDRALQHTRASMPVPELVLADIRRFPPRVERRLRAWGVLGDVPAGGDLPALVARYIASLRARGRSLAHVQLTESRLLATIDGVPMRTTSAMRLEALNAWLAGQRAKDKALRCATGALPKKFRFGMRTSNAYLGAATSFSRWLVLEGHLERDPFIRARALAEDADRRVTRRALTAGEVGRLLGIGQRKATKANHLRPFPPFTTTLPVCIPATDRVMLYRFALETGLRASELRSLTVGSLSLRSKPPTVTVEAGYSKRRRRDVLPLRREFARTLAGYIKGRKAEDPLLQMPSKSKVVEMLRRDLAAASINPLGVDFHALRHTFITNLARGGVHPKLAQELARHSTITLTMEHYTHVTLSELAKALEGAKMKG